MAQVVVTKSKIDAIVDAVNAKAGTTGTKGLDALPEAIANIPSGGGDELEKIIDGTIESIVIPSSVNTIKSYTFYGCSSLTSASWNKDNSNTFSIRNSAFYNTNLTSVNFNGTFSVESYAFYNGIKTVNTFSFGKMTSIGNYTFYNFNANGSNSVTWDMSESTYTTVPSYAFYGMKNVTMMVPSTVTSVGDSAFAYSKYSNVYFQSAPNLSSTSGFTSMTSTYLYFKYNDLYKMMNATNWVSYKSVMKGYDVLEEDKTFSVYIKEGYPVYWYTEKECTNRVYSGTAGNTYYCTIGATKEASGVNLFAENCTVTLVDSEGKSYTTDEAIPFGKTVTLTIIPDTGMEKLSYTFNGEDFDGTYEYTVTDEEPSVTAVCWNGEDLPVMPTFADNSWVMIKLACDTNNIPSTWKIGDTKTVTLTDGYEYTIRICDISDRYTLSDNESLTNKMTFEFVEQISTTTYVMNSTTKTYESYSSYNAGGWLKSDMYIKTMPIILNMLPDDLKDVLKTVNITTGVGGGATSGLTTAAASKLFLPSAYEIFGSNSYSFADENTTQFELYKTVLTTSSDRRKAPVNNKATYNAWWLRSPRSGYTSYFVIVYNSGGINNLNAYNGYRVAPCFAI